MSETHKLLPLGTKVPSYGTIEGVMTQGGEHGRYYFFIDHAGCVAIVDESTVWSLLSARGHGSGEAR